MDNFLGGSLEFVGQTAVFVMTPEQAFCHVRFYDEEHHREAILTRPVLMSGVGRQSQSGGQKTVRVRVLHEKGDLVAQAVMRTSNELHQIRAITERWTVEQRWTLLLIRVLRRWLGGKWRLPCLILLVVFVFSAQWSDSEIFVKLWPMQAER